MFVPSVCQLAGEHALLKNLMYAKCQTMIASTAGGLAGQALAAGMICRAGTCRQSFHNMKPVIAMMPPRSGPVFRFLRGCSAAAWDVTANPRLAQDVIAGSPRAGQYGQFAAADEDLVPDHEDMVDALRTNTIAGCDG